MIKTLQSLFGRNAEKQTLSALLAGFLILFLAASLQIQGDFYDIRFNLADVALPFAGLFIVISLLLRQSLWPQWDIPHAYLFLVGLMLWMVISFVNGYYQIGGLSSWALYNKLAGFVVLICYFAMGGWLACNRGRASFSIFMAGFLLFFMTLFFAAFVSMVLYALGVEKFSQLYQFAGLMGNRNAYMLLLICVTVLVIILHRSVPDFIPRLIVPLYFVCLPFVAANNGSRAGWIILLLVALYFMVTQFKWFCCKILLWALLGCVLTSVLFMYSDQTVTKRKPLKRINHTITMLQDRGVDVLQEVGTQDSSVKKIASELIRMRNAKISADIWQAAPLMGGGLGAILHYQYMHYDPEKVYIDIMDCTPIWLLAETGAVGFLAFAAFYFLILCALWRKMKEAEGTEAAFAEALFVFMLAFGVMSLFHEVLYTRYLWVMMGMAAAVLSPPIKSA